MLVIFLFLRSASATLIPALAVPVSLIGTCAAMYAFGFSINNMTLLALTLSVGFVVDDAIVMLENIVRHIEGGMRPFEAALKGSREIGFTIVSITVLADRGVHPGAADGRHGRPRVPRIRGHAFRWRSWCRVSSSLTLTPMLCARVLRAHDEDRAKKKPNVVLRAVRARCFEAGLRVLRMVARPRARLQIDHARRYPCAPSS